jgi:hypothetical protein
MPGNDVPVQGFLKAAWPHRNKPGLKTGFLTIPNELMIFDLASHVTTHVFARVTTGKDGRYDQHSFCTLEGYDTGRTARKNRPL